MSYLHPNVGEFTGVKKAKDFPMWLQTNLYVVDVVFTYSSDLFKSDSNPSNSFTNHVNLTVVLDEKSGDH